MPGRAPLEWRCSAPGLARIRPRKRERYLGPAPAALAGPEAA